MSERVHEAVANNSFAGPLHQTSSDENSRTKLPDLASDNTDFSHPHGVLWIVEVNDDIEVGLSENPQNVTAGRPAVVQLVLMAP